MVGSPCSPRDSQESSPIPQFKSIDSLVLSLLYTGVELIKLLTKICIIKAMIFPVIMLRYQSCTIKKAEHQRTDAFKLVLEKILESPLDCKEIKPVNPKGNQPWIFIGRTGAEAPIIWPPVMKIWPIGKDLDDGKDWRQEEKGTTEDEIVKWHHGHEFEQASGVGDRQGKLVW